MVKQERFWLRVFNVRTEEKWLVKKLFILQFLQGAGIAFFFTAAFALFLERYEITDLPFVFIYSALLLWIAGFAYSKLEKRVSGVTLSMIITIFMATSILGFRLTFFTSTNDYFLYWMLAFFNVLYLLNNLEFWGLASLTFNARQSKRLFAVISAGDIPAKFVGYTLALLLVDYIGTVNLLWMGMACMLLSIPYILILRRSGKVQELHHHHAHNVPHGGFRQLIQKITGNSLTRSLAILTVIISSSYMVVNFAFYAGVKSSYNDEVELAKFIAFFLAVVRILALAIKMIFTSRLVNKLGIINALLITPVVMLLMVIAIVASQNMSSYNILILYFFGITSIVVDILRSSINSPVFLTIMQPLPTHERLRAHTIVKGIMDPFASLFTGILLLVLIYFQQKVDLLTLAYVLLAFGCLWIYSIYKVNRQYINTIIKTISGRYFNGGNYLVDDSNNFSLLKERLRTGSETEAVNILGMMTGTRSEIKVQMVMLALQHPSDKVKVLSMKMAREQDLKIPIETLMPFLESNNNELIAITIDILSKSHDNEQLVAKFIDHPVHEIRKASLNGILLYGNGEIKKKAEAILHSLVNSENEDDRLLAAQALCEMKTEVIYDHASALMNDESKLVRRSAFYAAAYSQQEGLLKQLVAWLPFNEKEVIAPLLVAGESALSVIHNAINKSVTNELQSEKLIQLIGIIGGIKSHVVLLTLLTTHPEYTRSIIKALYRSNFVPKLPQQENLNQIVNKTLAHSAGIVYMQSKLMVAGDKYQLLINSFQLELNQLRDTLLYIFAMMYNRDNINKVQSAYLTGKRELIINAMEIIDITVRKDHAAHFNIIFEPGNSIDRMDTLRKNYPASFITNVEEVLERILAEEKKPFHNWTKACSLYTSKKQHHKIDLGLIKKYTLAENVMLRETAEYAC